MSSAPPITFATDGDGVGWMVFDDPAGRANILHSEAQRALGTAIDAAAASKARAIVIISGKDRIFIAGANLKSLAALPDAEAAMEFSRAGQQLFQRINALPVPVVCAIHGACAGGGFELALACHWRIATDAPVTRIGLPETGIGTIPGWGGCVRLPRLIGVKPALDHILKAQLIPAAAALSAGLVNELVAPEALKARARAAALTLADDPPPPRPSPAAVRPEYFVELRESVRVKTRGHLPAPLAAIDAIEQTASLSITEALEIEARMFGTVTAGEVCRNLIHAFLLRDAARKRTLDGWFERPDGESHAPTPKSRGQRDAAIRRVGVVGAGVMGSGIAQWLAAHGFDVVMRDVQPELLERGVQVVRRLFGDAVKRGHMTESAAADGVKRIRTTTAWEGFETCDLVIEAIVEDVAAKQNLFRELAAIVRPDALLASNTSALPIEEIAGHVLEPSRTLGIHFFNPVSRMPLVELNLAPATSAYAAERALAFVKALEKSPVICRSSPGFLVTRVLFFYLNEAVRLWEQGVETVAMDEAMCDFGWPMGPLRLIDEVGVDVTDFIFAEMEHYFPGRFNRTTACARMLAAGWKGRKNGASAGFYTYATGEAVNDAETRRLVGRLGDPDFGSAEIAERLMRVMAGEAIRCLDEDVVKSADDVDFALLTGAGFPGFRGGLMRWTAATGVST